MQKSEQAGQARQADRARQAGQAEQAQLQSYVRSLRRSAESLHRPDRPDVFVLDGREWDLLDGVFAPPFSASTGVAMELLAAERHAAGGARSQGRQRSLLEIGCGTGVIAVTAALTGHDRVVASDISPQAARNTALNAARHGVADRVRTLCGDLFAPLGELGEDERFDTVYWHSNFVKAPEHYVYGSMHERAYVDAGYAAHRRYLAGAHDHLAPGGRVLLHFSDRGDVLGLRRTARECGRGLRVLRSLRVREGQETVEHMLLEVTAARAALRPAA
ncbi:methyltransferase domain-containing protein [Streptomyces roseifaciens]|uniref:methyltransferase domain-containing protein n=1 Tax=Streptomyces roseifaciens TaxID=1488406 RepID=UPI00099F60DB|nr:methyltransferase domain-containing protein [Streptomyces roseifaciens]